MQEKRNIFIRRWIIERAIQWQSRILEPIYPIVLFDAIFYKVREEGKIKSKAAYACLAINLDGRKDLLGLWVSETEGAKTSGML